MTELLSDSFWPVVIVLGLAFVGTLVVYAVRRWFKQPDVPFSTGFTLQELRKLRKEGQITEEEFTKAAALIGKTHSAQFLSSSKPDPKSDKTR